ncbi:MAG: MFS transporter [Candidatus Aminicenantes bacterium]|uniref:Putative transporter n=1 Tax=Candidatus Saccharicenans subterraneus TaxID=2508984 RepID=A0A3E2BM21_9BACT|nr:MFS transporter [Candidatus Aminicenantes bacterium]RFT15793.1 MAG: putative transporter [Candidatus Saccharicenans subterraneum]
MDQEINETSTQFLPRLLALGKKFSWRQTFYALKYPNYRLWFWGQLISVLGSWMQMTAQAFLVYELTHSPAYLGYAGFAAGLPTWLFMLYGGVVADRIPRRRIMILTQLALMILAFILAGLVFLRLVQPWHIIILAFCTGIVNAFDAPARQAFVMEMIEPDALTNAIALNSAMFNSAQALGPAASGIIYAAVGPAWCFTINGLSFIAVIVALALMKLRPFVPRQSKNSIIQDLKEGVEYVLKHNTIRILVLTVAITTLFGRAFITILPAWAVQILGGNARTNGFLLTASGLGALTGALFIASFSPHLSRGKLLILGMLFYPVSIILFALSRFLPLSLLLLFVSGVGVIIIYNLANALVQIHTPENIRGRVMSIYSFVFFGLMPFAALWIGAAANNLGEKIPVLASAIIFLVYAAAIFIFDRRLVKLR